MNEGNRWYALAVKPQHEFRAFDGLIGMPGVEAFLPTFKDKRIWSDRVKILDSPLFPGYVFARFPYPSERVPILRQQASEQLSFACRTIVFRARAVLFNL